jgi:tRNA pseudouridine13 synthase
MRDGLSGRMRKKLHLGDRTPKLNVPQYLSVVIYKENVESMTAVNYVARRIRKVPKQMGIAGNKDKRGITTQRCTILRADAEQLIRQQRCKDWDPKIKVGSFERVF